MAKTKKQPIAEVGDRLIVPGSVGILEAIIPGKKPKYQVKWANDRTGFYTEFELQTITYQIEKKQVEPELEDIQEEEENLWEQFGIEDITPYQWQLGNYAFDSILGEVKILEVNENTVKVLTSDNCSPWLSEEGTKLLRPCEISKPVEFSRESVGSPEQLSLLEGLTGESQLNGTKMQLPSSNPTLTIESSAQTSETFTQTQENTTSLLEDFPAQIPAEPETELELLTYLQSLGQCSASSSELLEKPDPSSSFWNSLRDLSIEDLEHGLEDCEWADIKASIQSSRQRMNLARTLRGKDCLSFPTLLAGHGRKYRDVGLTHCETWWKQNVIREIGLQLSSEAIASLHGFPANWFKAISPPCHAQPDTQDDSQPESLEGKLSLSPRQKSHSNASNESGQSLAESLGKLETHTERESKQAGSLYQYTSNKRGKDGVIREYPIVEGRDRDRALDDDWYWGISYIEVLNGKRCDCPRGTARRVDRSASIPRKSLPLARVMMSAGFIYSATIEAAQYKFCWLDFKEKWAIGEIRPEICPSLFICSLEEREFLIIPASSWGELRVEARTRLRRLIMGAIDQNETLTYIKEKLNAQ